MELETGKIYRHYRGGHYKVVLLAEDATGGREGEIGVVYQSLTLNRYFYRKYEEFTKEVIWPDEVRRPRFVLDPTQAQE